MYQILMVGGTIEYISKRWYRSFFLANKSKIYGVRLVK